MAAYNRRLRIHHLACGRFRPPFGLLTQGGRGLLTRADYIVHCLLVELSQRLVLVDTGMSAADMCNPRRALGIGMAYAGGVCVAPTALEQVQRLGFTSGEVTDIVITHLDKDHAGGLADFPLATVHIHPAELNAALHRRTFIDRERYSRAHFAHSPRWSPVDSSTAIDWHGLQRFPLPDLPDISLIHLPGHSAGHCGVLLEGQGKPLLHCGDAVYHVGWLSGGRPPIAIRLVEQLLAHDRFAHRATIRRLQELQQSGEVRIFCAHDRAMFTTLGGVD